MYEQAVLDFLDALLELEPEEIGPFLAMAGVSTEEALAGAEAFSAAVRSSATH